jgi:hypothetical protein
MLNSAQTRPSPFTQTIVPATDRSASVSASRSATAGCSTRKRSCRPARRRSGRPSRGCRSCAADQQRDRLFTLARTTSPRRCRVSYPGSGVLRHSMAPARCARSRGATPAAGAEISETVPDRRALGAARDQRVTDDVGDGREPSAAICSSTTAQRAVYLRSKPDRRVTASLASRTRSAKGSDQFTSASSD